MHHGGWVIAVVSCEGMSQRDICDWLWSVTLLTHSSNSPAPQYTVDKSNDLRWHSLNCLLSIWYTNIDVFVTMWVACCYVYYALVSLWYHVFCQFSSYGVMRSTIKISLANSCIVYCYGSSVRLWQIDPPMCRSTSSSSAHFHPLLDRWSMHLPYCATNFVPHLTSSSLATSDAFHNSHGQANSFETVYFTWDKAITKFLV